MRKIEAPECVKDDFETWSRFLEREVEFWLKDSEKHTKEHCQRVLLFSLLIACKLELNRHETKALCMASVFHDSRRQDDWYDVGHGQRAADYYKAYCMDGTLEFDQRCYDVMAYHDRDDVDGIAAIKNSSSDPTREALLYQAFKDADALDRFRLGPNGLDPRYLRTDAAKSLYGYARNLWNQVSEPINE